MHEETANADRVRGVDEAPGGVLEQGSANAFAMMRCRYRESGKYDDWDRIRHVASKATRRRRKCDRARGQRVVGNNDASFTDYEGAGCSGRLIAAGATLEPFIENRLGA